jgi:hypothetical protein
MPRDPQPSHPVRKGQRVSAAARNREIELLRQGRIEAIPPLHSYPTGGGTVVYLDDTPDIWAAVQSYSGGVYTLLEQIPDASGMWTDGTQTITAREINGNATVPAGTIVRVKWDRTAGYWFFQSSRCT